MAIRAWAKQRIPSNGGIAIRDDTDDKDDNMTAPDPVKRAAVLLKYLETSPRLESPSINAIQTNDISSDDASTTKLPSFPCNWVLEVCARPQPDTQKRLEAYQLAVDTFHKSRRNSRSYVLMANVIKEQVLYAPSNAINIHDDNNDKNNSNEDEATKSMHEAYIKVLIELFQECCHSGMLSQEMIWHVVDVATITSLQDLFGLTYQYAELAIQMRDSNKTISSQRNMSNSDLSSPPDRRYTQAPSSLLIRNLPPEWSANANTQRNSRHPRGATEEEEYFTSTWT
jgi:hypothetical protein